MPPKKDQKKQPNAKPDNSGIPKQDVEIKFSFQIQFQSTQPPCIGLMWEWFGSQSDKIQRYQTSLLQSWKKQQNRLIFEKQCDLIRVDDDFCKRICSKRNFIYFVNGQDNKVEDKLYLDYSSLLTSKNNQFLFQSKTIRVLGLTSFKIKIVADKPLIGDIYKRYLNPLQVEVIGAKDAPLQKSTRYEPSYVKYKFFDETQAQTHQVVGNNMIVWSHKHVFLAGLLNPIQLKQKIRSKFIKFQLHDRDQIVNRKPKPQIQLMNIEQAIKQELQKQKPLQIDPKKKVQPKKQQKKQVKKETKKDPKKKDAKLGEPILGQQLQYQKNNYGVALFSLIQFLKPTTRSSRYKAPIVPRYAYEDFESKNLDLNTTARNQMQKILVSNNYFDCDTILVVGFNLAYPIQAFQLPKTQAQKIQQLKSKKQLNQNKKYDIKKGDFERRVFLVPYKNSQVIKKIQDAFYESNLKAFNMNNKRQLTTYVLKPQQRQSKTIDYISGIQICDPDGRIYIFQGLRNGNITKLGEFSNNETNQQFKILKDQQILFSQRILSEFNIQIKRIRIRPNLNQLLIQPSIYIKSKVPQQISSNLIKLGDIRKLSSDLHTLDLLNLWPHALALIQIQRKYSQALSLQDLTGKSSAIIDQKSIAPAATSIKLFNNAQLKNVSAEQIIGTKPVVQLQQTKQDGLGDTKSRKMVMTKTFTKDPMVRTQSYNMRGKAIVTDTPVYIYAGQKLNFYQKQMQQFRQKMDPNSTYTYDKNFLGLAIDRNTMQKQKKKDMELSQSKMYSQDKFSSLLVRTKQQRIKLPKKIEGRDAEDILNYPYHENKTLQLAAKKSTRDQPIEGKIDFQKYIRPQQIFSLFPSLPGQNISSVQRASLQKQQLIRQKQLQKSLLKGPANFSIKKQYHGDHTYGIDRFKDIRQGSAVKKGIIDKHKPDGKRRVIQPYQPSYNLKQTHLDPSFNPLIRRDNDAKNLSNEQFNHYQRPQILTRTQLYKPLKNVI